MWRSSLALGIAVTAGASVSPALAVPPVSPVEPSTGAMSVEVRSGVEVEGRRWVMAGERVVLGGRVAAAERAGGLVTIGVSAEGKRVAVIEAPLRSEGSGARFEASFRASRPGRYLIEVGEGEARSTAAVQAITARVRRGSQGMGVKLLQRGLGSLGYATSHGGRYDGATARAVIAYRKVNGMARRAAVGQQVMARVMAGQGAFRPRYPRAGRHVEFDFSRQVLVLVRGGRAERVYHASSGKASTPTVFGTFRFYRKQPGTNAKGMVHSNYFIRGYAIHGFRSVPMRPASHGCIRVPIPNARFISRWISLGDRIHVYR